LPFFLQNFEKGVRAPFSNDADGSNNDQIIRNSVGSDAEVHSPVDDIEDKKHDGKPHAGITINSGRYSYVGVHHS